MRSPDVAAVAERIQDIAFTLRERAVGADLCDALDAAVREIVDTCGDGASLHTGDKNQSAGAVAEHENGDAASFAKTGPFMMDALESTKFTEAAATLSAALHSSGDEPAAASRRQSEPSEAVIAALGHEPDLAAGQARGSDKSPRWYIEPPDFAFQRADPEQLQPPLSAMPAENGHAHSLLPQAKLLPGPQDDPADLFESPTEASATAAAIVTPAPAIVAPAAIAPPLMRLMPRAPQPDSLAGLRALSEEEVIVGFSCSR